MSPSSFAFAQRTKFLLLLSLPSIACAVEAPPEEAASSALTQIGGAGLAAPAVSTLAPPPGLPGAQPVAPVAQALESGVGWRRVKVTGSAEDSETGVVQPLAEEYYVIDGRAAIANTSLPANTRQILAAKMSAAPLPDPGDQEVIIVPKRLDEVVQSGVTFFGICDDKNNRLYSKSYDVDRTYSYHKASEPGAFTGSSNFSTRLKGNITGEVKYSIRYSFCIPTLVIHRVTVYGNADVLASAAIDASFHKKWSWDHQVAAPVLGTVSVAGVPITFKAPITVGLDAEAAAQLRANASYQAHGVFNIRCNGSGCAGYKSATHSFSPAGAPSVAVSGKVKITPWAEGAVRAYVIDEWVVHAQVGVRARLDSELWGYFGNSCGDADHDGNNELVSGATLDLGLGIDVVARAGFLGSDLGPWSWNVWNRHLAFWPLGGNALDPIFYSESCGGTTATMRGRMRPCWPYPDRVTYRLSWGDGAVASFSGGPTTLFTRSHAFASYGDKPIRLEAVQDAKGRTLAGSTQRNVNITWLPVACHATQVLARTR